MESAETDRLIETQKKVKKVEDITRENVSKVMDRGDNLEDLQRRTNALNQSSNEFSYTARRLKRKMWWQNIKLWLILLFLLIVILVVLIIALAAVVNKH